MTRSTAKESTLGAMADNIVVNGLMVNSTARASTDMQMATAAQASGTKANEHCGLMNND